MLAIKAAMDARVIDMLKKIPFKYIDNNKKALIDVHKIDENTVAIKMIYANNQDFLSVKDKIKSYGFRYDGTSKQWLGSIEQYRRLSVDIFDYLNVSARYLAYEIGSNHRVLQVIKQRISSMDNESNQLVSSVIDVNRIEIDAGKIALRIDKDIEIIKGLIPTIYDYQLVAVREVLKNYYGGKSGYVINDAPGLGKTIEIIAFLLAVYHKGMTVYFFSTNAMVNIIIDEFYKFDKQNFLTRYLSTKPQDQRICILPYSILTAKKQVHTLISTKADIIILDEAHNIKNIRAKRTKMLEQVRKNTRFILCTTGTLFKNRPAESYNVLRITGVIEPKTRMIDFIHAFEGAAAAYFYSRNMHTKYYYTIQKEAVARFRDFLNKSGQYIRREKEDVLTELPEKVRLIIPIEIQSNAHELLQAMRAEEALAQKLVSSSYKLSKDEASKLATFRRVIGTFKADYVLDYVRDNLVDRDKLIIFAYHREVIDKLASGVREIMPEHDVYLVHGASTPKEKDRAVVAFQNEGTKTVLVISLAVMSEGVTLTKSHDIVFAEVDWVPSTMIQAEDRIHRISQKAKSCFYHYMIALKTLDQYIYNVINAKNRYINVFNQV